MPHLTLGLLLTLALGLLVAPLAAGAQRPANVPRIGMLLGNDADAAAPSLEAFRHRLHELGYVEGQTIAIEYRFADGKLEPLPALAAELVQLAVDVIVTAGTPATRAARHATRMIPIVIATAADLVGQGFVASLARPGGNITGLEFADAQLVGKRFELLKVARRPSRARRSSAIRPTRPMTACSARPPARPCPRAPAATRGGPGS